MQSMHLQLQEGEGDGETVNAPPRRNDARAREEALSRQAGSPGLAEIAYSLRIAQSLFSDSLHRYVEL